MLGTLLRCRRAAAFVAIVLLPRVAQPSTIERVLVLDLASTGVDANVARNLSEVFAAAVRNAVPAATVLGQSEINTMLALEKQRDVLGCAGDVSCLAEIGGALGADHLAAGSVGKVGEVYLLTLKLVDTREAKTVRQISEKVLGSADRLIEATIQWGANLFDPSKTAGIGYLNITGAGQVSVDGKAVGAAPVRHYPVKPGPVQVLWQQAGKQVEKTVEVEAYTEMRVDSEQRVVAAPEPVTPPSPPIERAGLFARVAFGWKPLLLSVPGDTNSSGGGEGIGSVEVGYTLPPRIAPFVTASILVPRFKTSLDVDPNFEGASVEFKSLGVGAAYIVPTGRLLPGAMLLSPSVALMYSWLANHYCGGGTSTTSCSEDTSASYPYGFGNTALTADVAFRFGYAVSRYLDLGVRLDLFISKVDNGTFVALGAGVMAGLP